MKQLLRQSTMILYVGIATVVLLIVAFFAFIAPRVSAAEQTGRLVTVHDRGDQKTVLSDASTVEGALEDAGIALDSHDAVEPALDAELVAREYEINIYRARPVIIVDGPMRQKVITPYQAADRIVKDAGITLNPEDKTMVMRTDNLVADGASLQLIIDRATELSINLFGTKTSIRTQGETVGEMLQEKNIELEHNDRASVNLSAPITAGMQISIWREGKQTITVEEAVQFDTEQIRDADRPYGYKEIRTEGKKGLRNVTYEIEIKDGVEIARSEIATIVTKPAVKQVEVVGAKVTLSVHYSADRAAIMTAAGVALKDQDYAAYIINHENALWCAIRWQGTTGCGDEYYVKFPGAETSDQVGYGLCQSTPAIKMETAGSDWRTNAVTQMKWCHSYAISRYGSWEAAYYAKVAKGWW
jgi:uncharacterized protein YabE (DUF348 family)